MMTGDLKTKIENLWDFLWSNGMTNPLTVVEQITYLMFIKMLDDDERTQHIFGEKYRQCRWRVFRRFNAHDMYTVLADTVFPFIRSEVCGSSSDTFAKYFKDAVFSIPNPRVLERVVEAIDDIGLEDKDIMGDVYELLLSRMAQSGKNGQFRTPRHIVDMMVELAAPCGEDIICDPAMGTAGFINGALNHVRKKGQGEPRLYGFDTDQTMLRIGAMNLILHGAEEPTVTWCDSLSNDNIYRDKFTLILANPPFAGSLDKENVAPDLLQTVNTGKTELLFLALFTKMLKTGGRCATVVPSGVLSNSSNAHLTVRKELVENQRLEAVISMPSGVFLPYSAVSTAILIFSRDDRGGTDDVWFYDMASDGFSADPARTPTERNDIPDILARFRNPTEHLRKRSEQSFFVSKREIVENGYTLSFAGYSELTVKQNGNARREDELNRLKQEITALFRESHRLEKLIAADLDALCADTEVRRDT